MDWQHLFDLIFTFAVGVGGYVIKGLDNDIKSLQQKDDAIAKDITEIKVLVAGEYVKREEFEKTIVRLFEKLDTIQKAVSGKADR